MKSVLAHMQLRTENRLHFVSLFICHSGGIFLNTRHYFRLLKRFLLNDTKGDDAGDTPLAPLKGGMFRGYFMRCARKLILRFSIFIILASCLLAFPRTIHAQSADVPLQHAIYPFLERLVAYLPQHALDLHVIPISRAQTLGILQEAEAAQLALSHADQALLKQYLAEFTDSKAGERMPANGERHFLRYEEGSAQLFADLFGSQRFEAQRGAWPEGANEISRTRAGVRMRAQLPPRLLLAAEVSNILERGIEDSTEIFQPGSGSPVVLSGQSAFRETAIAYGRVRLPWFEIEAGRNHFSWNVSPLTQLALARDNQPFDLVRFDARWRKFRFVFAHVNLRASSRKFLAAHRLEVMPFSNFLFGVGESVIYGKRAAEFEYLNPLMLYHAAEHLLGDKDNNVLTLDFSYFPKRGLKLYSEIFIDDLSLEFPVGTYFGNKLAYLAGAFWVQPFGWRDADLRFEYARIDPFVYTHDDSANIYENDGEALGERFGPNADRVLLQLGYQPHRDLRFVNRLQFHRNGRGNLFAPHREADGLSKGFLKGKVARTFAWHFEVEDQIRRDIYMGLEFDWERLRNSNFIRGTANTRRRAAFFLRADF